MITCKECKERLYPEDPTIRTPRWIGGKMILYASPSNCEICSKPTYYRELEEETGEELSNKESIVYRKLRNDLNCTKAEQNYIFNKINSHLDASKKKAMDNKNKYNIYKDYNIGGVRHDYQADKADTLATNRRTQKDTADTADKADRS